ncbi:MAG: phenol hydroxylase subunit P4 [Porticoccaceae bacterium]
MPVKALDENYVGEVKDRVENFNGNYIVHMGWDHHLLFAAPLALLLSPDMLFSELLEKVIPDSFGAHPELETIDWEGVEWHLDGKRFEPDTSKTLQQLGVGHKSSIRFNPPGSLGINNAGV